jgi:hypothetical protein
MVIIILMALAVLFGALVLVSIMVGRKYEVRHKVGELTEAMDDDELPMLINKLKEESNSKENL